MGRRFLNLVLHDLRRSMYSLHRMDLRHLFYETAEIAKQAAEEASEKKNKLTDLSMIEPLNGLGKPVISSQAHNFFTLLRESRESTIMMSDTSGSTAILDIDFKSLLTMPPMDYGKGPNCVCFSTPDPNPYDPSLDTRCLFVLDLVPGSSTKSSFEVLKYFGSGLASQPLVSSHFNLNWNWYTLPVPAFLDDPDYSPATKMCSSMMLDGSTICVSSMQEGIGTYTFDKVSNGWSQVGNWVLPFCGKAEYVPDLKLWFALSASTPHSLSALALPATNFELPPELQHTWDYLDLPESPYQRHLVNLGSGKFCIVSFFRTSTFNNVKEIIKDESAVFTGLEVRRCKSAGGPFQMIKHMSKRYSFGKCIIHCAL